jgi:hypothetical protein
MSATDGLRYIKIPLNNGSDEIPALGFGTLIPDPIGKKDAGTRCVLDAHEHALLVATGAVDS